MSAEVAGRVRTGVEVEGVVGDWPGRRLELRAHAAQRGGGQRPARAPGARLARARGQSVTLRGAATLSCAVSVR